MTFAKMVRYLIYVSDVINDYYIILQIFFALFKKKKKEYIDKLAYTLCKREYIYKHCRHL